MTTYSVGVAVPVTFELTDLNGDDVTPTELSVRVLDESEAVLVAATAIAVPDPLDDIIYTVASAINVLVDQIAAARTVELTITTATGSFKKRETYLLKEALQLTTPENTFQTYAQALVQASIMPAMTEWEAASVIVRENALRAAYDRLTAFAYAARHRDEVDMDHIVDIFDEDFTVSPSRWQTMTLEQYEDLPAHFRTALCKAQIVEANEMMKVGTAGNKRRDGILSESIGESSMMFRSGKSAEYSISSAAMRYLGGYISRRLTLTRT